MLFIFCFGALFFAIGKHNKETPVGLAWMMFFGLLVGFIALFVLNFVPLPITGTASIGGQSAKVVKATDPSNGEALYLIQRGDGWDTGDKADVMNYNGTERRAYCVIRKQDTVWQTAAVWPWVNTELTNPQMMVLLPEDKPKP